MIESNFCKPIEIMCDTSGVALAAFLGKKKKMSFRPVYYASKALSGAHKSYTVTEQEIHPVVYAFENFRATCKGPKWWCILIVLALWHLMENKDAKP